MEAFPEYVLRQSPENLRRWAAENRAIADQLAELPFAGDVKRYRQFAQELDNLAVEKERGRGIIARAPAFTRG